MNNQSIEAGKSNTEPSRFVFFSMNNFSKEGGGTVRMAGIINGLARKGHEIFFISNCLPEKTDLFHPDVLHIPIDYLFTRRNKAMFQFAMSILPISFINFFYSKLLKKLKDKIRIKSSNNCIFFFEYIDNTIAYWLKHNKVIEGYIDDLHGIAAIEFDIQRKATHSIINKAKFYLKSLLSKQLDNKQYRDASGFIYASHAMHGYFVENFTETADKQAFILPYMTLLLDENRNTDKKLEQELKEKWKISGSEKLILFAGAFKVIDGVLDLIDAFHIINKEQNNLRLILVGDGPTRNDCVIKVKKLGLEEKVIFAGRIPYEELPAYQSMCHIIACPNRQNPFSDLMVHVKYFDALTSGKIVIGGAFKSILEINKEEQLSLLFKPSDVNSLADALKRAINEYEILVIKYHNNLNFVKENLTYDIFFDRIRWDSVKIN